LFPPLELPALSLENLNNLRKRYGKAYREGMRAMSGAIETKRNPKDAGFGVAVVTYGQKEEKRRRGERRRLLLLMNLWKGSEEVGV
jgi:hypothetical protein